ncbi:NUDIX hydrolase [Paenibacillus albidus]|uniref:NUDIX hydrolase n=1 Tax=Paenibacillus albidus TaxID=2041023 RepID=UPI001BEAFEB4|nr:NUDIX hydrolase [Paenibacillus albidus]MBT2289384.1 NUDIX hydrolase [Paenibacillus albidus]
MGYIMELRKLVGSRPLLMAGACVLLSNDGRLLLQRRTDNGCWGLPGGSMEPGESAADTAARELLEETGLAAKRLKLFEVFSGEELYYKYPNGDEVYNIVCAYLCTEYEGTLTVDGDEVQDLRFWGYGEIPGELSPPDRPVIQAFLQLKNKACPP